jgi:MFS family permease
MERYETTKAPLMIDSMSTPAPNSLTATQWIICAVACLGFAFDVYEAAALPLIARPAVTELSGLESGSAGFNLWVGVLFFVPFAVGGIFGLLGGYFTDRFGRRRVLVWSILLYGFSALTAAYATSLPALLFFRCTTMLGICVEFVAAVAWLAELFPNPERRESVLGYTQASAAIGGLIVTIAYYFAVTHGEHLPAIRGGHEAWRYTLAFGMLPTIPLIVVRPFLPESPVWREKKSAGTLQRPHPGELFRPALLRTTVVTTMLVACSYGAAFGALLHLPRIVPALPQVVHLTRQQQEQTVSAVNFFLNMGDLAGRLALALLVNLIVSRRRLLRVFVVPGLIIFPLLFIYPSLHNLELLKYGTLIAAAVMTAQFSFWGNYLPRVYPTHLRGTGESFATNIGGRMLGTSAALVTTQLASVTPGANATAQLAYAAASVGLLVYLIALIASFWLPEPESAQLPT